MAKGDHLVVSYGTYTHHGIDMGDGTVIAYSRKSIKRVKHRTFRNGGEVWVQEYSACSAPAVVVRRALRRVGEADYDLLTNNCEHFARWCKTGEHTSTQVRRIQRRGVSVVAKGATNVLTKVVAKNSTKLASKSLTRASTPCLLIADAAQLTTEVAMTNLLSADPEYAELAGRGVGLLSSVAIGASVAGPVGAGFGLGTWILGEAFSAFVTS